MNEIESARPASTPVDWLEHQWVLAGVVASAARFVPVPFVDDIIRGHCRRFVVTRTLAAGGSPLSAEDLRPLHADAGGVLGGCLGALGKLMLTVILFPVRKIAAILTSVHGVPMEIMRTVLLGRTLRRLLQSGRADPARAEAMRSAFDEAFSRMDFHTVRAALVDALRGVRHWRASAVRSARRLASAPPAADPGLPADEQVETTAASVQAVLDRPETARLFEEFDRRFDAAYARRGPLSRQ